MRTLFSFLLLFVTHCSLAQLAANVAQQLQKHFQDKASPGLLIGYAHADTSFALAYGLADTATAAPLTPNQLMMSGSTGKIVVAAAVLKLVAEGKLQLDDPISEYLQENWHAKVPNYSCLTVRQLLQHRSGLPRYIFTDFADRIKEDPDKHWTAQERLAFADSATFACGEDFAYSDTNYILLGSLVETLTGLPFYTCAQKEILAPLGLRSFQPTDRRRIAGLANGYPTDQDPLGFTGTALLPDGSSRYNMQFEWTGGGYAYNPQDMARLLVAIFEGKVFGQALLEEYRQTLPAPEIKAAYGLGIMEYEIAGRKLYGHSGFFPGYIAQVYYDLATESAYVFQINTTLPEGVKKLYEGIHSFFAQPDQP